MSGKPLVALAIPTEVQAQVLDAATREQLAERFETRYAQSPKEVSQAEAKRLLAGADGCMTGWWAPKLTAELLAVAPKLGVVAHAAGSVKSLVSDALWAQGIRVTSAGVVLAEDAAHTALALMILGRKNVFELSPLAHRGIWKEAFRMGHRPADDLRGCVVGLIGASAIGRRMMQLLVPFDVRILLYDPFVTAADARALGAEKVELDEIFARSDVVSLHAPALTETKHLVDARRLALMRDGALLINTARGLLIDETALVAELQKRRLWAILDVTNPEPPPPGSPLLTCPNLTLIPHLAGSIGRARARLGALACEELRRFFAGEPALHPITKDMLSHIA